MSTLAEKYEEDEEWIRNEIPGISEELQEDFAERVSVMTCQGMDERRSRMLARQRIEKKLYA